MPKRDLNETEVEFVDKVPASNRGGKWVVRLTPLLRHKGKYARVAVFGTREQAMDAQNNLSQRKAKIPYPDHEWWFGARDTELYARYLGPKKPRVRKVK